MTERRPYRDDIKESGIGKIMRVVKVLILLVIVTTLAILMANRSDNKAI